MRITSALLFAALLAVPAVGLACNDHDHGTNKSKRVAAGRESAWIAGVVREVDAEDATITLGHAKIAVLGMGAMDSMMFKAANPALLQGAAPGDKVRFRVRLVEGQPTVTRLSAVKS